MTALFLFDDVFMTKQQKTRNVVKKQLSSQFTTNRFFIRHEKKEGIVICYAASGAEQFIEEFL